MIFFQKIPKGINSRKVQLFEEGFRHRFLFVSNRIEAILLELILYEQ
jgi:hypothetical protein